MVKVYDVIPRIERRAMQVGFSSFPGVPLISFWFLRVLRVYSGSLRFLTAPLGSKGFFRVPFIE